MPLNANIADDRSGHGEDDVEQVNHQHGNGDMQQSGYPADAVDNEEVAGEDDDDDNDADYDTDDNEDNEDEDNEEEGEDEGTYEDIVAGTRAKSYRAPVSDDSDQDQGAQSEGSRHEIALSGNGNFYIDDMIE